MRFLLDENVSRSVGERLQGAGFSATDVIASGLGSAADEEVLAYAQKKKLVVITHDKDFGNLIRFPVQNHHGVILLRFRNQKPANVIPYLLQFLKTHQHLGSRLAILREDGLRIV